MEINKSLLDNLLEQAAASPRLRMNYDLRTSALRQAQGELGSGTGSGQALPEDSSQRMLNALLPGTVLPIHRHTKTTEVLVLLRGKMEEIFLRGRLGKCLGRRLSLHGSLSQAGAS